MKKIFGFFLLTILAVILLTPKVASKQNELPSITIINIIRGKELGHEKDDLVASLKDQWLVTSQVGVNATWLWQYGALEDEKMTDFAKEAMKDQEYGLLFEIDRNYAEKSGVSYRGQGPSYFSDGLLLVSYDKNERIKLIDSAFSKFKNVFGYYPKTVGAWWIGGDAISYMQKKYHITAVLRASDQYLLDVYTIWGTPWNIPYIPSNKNEGIPASSWEESSKAVILQWAIRDPVKGYYDSLYSLQDYSIKGYDLIYVNYLLNNFLKESSDNVVIGLENGGNPQTFSGFYKNMLQEAKKWEADRKAEVLLARDFAKEFLNKRQVLNESSANIFNDFDSDSQSVWINSINYRAFIEKIGENIYLSDLRDYSQRQSEDFSLLPNSQGKLWVSSKYLIDSRLFPDSRLHIGSSSDKISLVNDASTSVVYAGDKKIGEFSKNNLKIYGKDKIKSYNFSISEDGLNPILILFLYYLIYLILFYFQTKNKREVFLNALVFFIILFLAYSFITPKLNEEINFLFDKKQFIFFYLFPFDLFNDVKTSLVLFQLMPLLALPFLHFVFQVKKNLPSFYFLILLSYVLIYSHLEYFPLDKTNAITIFSVLFVCFLLLFAASFYLWRASKKMLKASVVLLTLAFLIITLTTVYSRATHVITPFEVDALQLVKNEKRDVIFVSQVDYSIKPIYKAVRPLLYENLNLAKKITGVKWKNVLRPQNDILEISDYKDKLIYIPRYLGSDISEYEIKNLKLKKIFDNLQVAIYHSE